MASSIWVFRLISTLYQKLYNIVTLILIINSQHTDDFCILVKSYYWSAIYSHVYWMFFFFPMTVFIRLEIKWFIYSQMLFRTVWSSGRSLVTAFLLLFIQLTKDEYGKGVVLLSTPSTTNKQRRISNRGLHSVGHKNKVKERASNASDFHLFFSSG